MKTIIVLTALLILLVGCNGEVPSMKSCTDSINAQVYSEGCERYDDYEYHYELRTKWEDSLPNSSYTIDRHYDECILNDTIYYVDYDPFIENKYDYYGDIISNKTILDLFAYSFGVPVECPESEFMIGYEFCYKKWISCNVTRHYKNGTVEKMVYATERYLSTQKLKEGK